MPIPLGILAVAGAGAAGGGAFDLLETTLISTNTASVTFSNLNTYSDYKHLQIRFTARSVNANSSNNNMYLRMNGDTGANYSYHYLNGSGSTVSSSAGTSAGFTFLLDASAGNTNTAGIFGAGIVDLLDFSSISKNKTIRALHGSLSVSETDITLSSGLWMNTNAVTSLSLEVPSNDLVAGSRFSLYGIK